VKHETWQAVAIAVQSGHPIVPAITSEKSATNLAAHPNLSG